MAQKRKTTAAPAGGRTDSSRSPVRVEGNTSLDVGALREIIEILEASEVTRLVWTRGEEQLIIRRGPHPVPVQMVAAPAAGPAVTVAAAPAAAPLAAVPAAAPAAAPAATAAPAAAAPAAPAAEKPGQVVSSPFVGTFYRSPAPDQPPFVDVGSVVKKGQTLCIIEAMKLMNEIESEFDGKVTEILAENGNPVEFGQPLFRIEKV